MDLIQDYTTYAPGPGVQQTGPPLQPVYYGAAGIGPNQVTNYKKALWGGEWSDDPLDWLYRYNKIWAHYGIRTPEQILKEFAQPSKLLTFAILAAGTESEGYMARYIGLVGGDGEDWRENVHRILARSLPINRFPGALWDPRFDPNVGYAVVPSVYDPNFVEKLSGDYQAPRPYPMYEKSILE